MKILISHSWKNKITADKLSRRLSKLAEVWIDYRELYAGDQIQDTIDKAIERVDAVIVLWSQGAAQSKNVRAEIETSRRLGKRLIPCLLDDTTFDDVPGLAGRLGIDYREERLGFGRLCIQLMRNDSPDLGMDLEEEMKDIKDVAGVQDYLLNYHSKQGIKDEDAEYWFARSTEAVKQVDSTLSQIDDRTEKAKGFLGQIIKEMGEAGGNRGKLQAVLQKVIRHEHTDPEMIGRIREVLERNIAELPLDVGLAPKSLANMPKRTRAFANGLKNAQQSGRDQIKSHLQRYVDARMLDNVTDLVLYYISTARQNLDSLGNYCVSCSSASGMMVVECLMNYLEDPNDLMPESKLGIWGFLDDAWLIHNTAYRLVEAQMVPASVFPVDWQKIASADNIAVRCLPNPVRGQLESSLMQFMQVLAAEVNSYNPTFAQGGQGYHPYMDEAPAVGGTGVDANLYGEYADSIAASANCFDFGY